MKENSFLNYKTREFIMKSLKNLVLGTALVAGLAGCTSNPVDSKVGKSKPSSFLESRDDDGNIEYIPADKHGTPLYGSKAAGFDGTGINDKDNTPTGYKSLNFDGTKGAQK